MDQCPWTSELFGLDPADILLKVFITNGDGKINMIMTYNQIEIFSKQTVGKLEINIRSSYNIHDKK